MVVSIAQAQMFFLALTRVMAILVQIPLFGSQIVPAQIKIAFGIILTMFIIPWQPLGAEVEAMTLFAFAAAILQEIIIGLLAGFAVVLVFGMFQMAGKIIELGSGFSSGQLFNPTLGEMGSAYDQFFIMTTLLFFFITNGHHVFLIGIKQTFDVLPINSAIPGISLETLLAYTTNLMTGAIQISFPISVSLMITDFSLGLLARVAPQIQVFFLGLPVKIWIALFALMVSIQIILPLSGNVTSNLADYMLGLLGA
jgi:flagellar biosynthesis protein FliR